MVICNGQMLTQHAKECREYDRALSPGLCSLGPSLGMRLAWEWGHAAWEWGHAAWEWGHAAW